MTLLLTVSIALASLAFASFLAVYTYGRFATRARGPDSRAFALPKAQTALDREAAKLVESAGGRNGLILLSNNLDAFAARALTAQAASRSLDLIYYIWKADLTGSLMLHEVIEAADRGARVRLLLDDINAHGNDDIWQLALDSHRNIEVRLFNPGRARQGTFRRGIEVLLRPFSLTRRMHNKAWIADGRLAIIGGRNIGDGYFDAAETSNFHDLDLMMLGPAVQGTEEIFDAFWNSGSELPIRALAGEPRRRLKKLRSRLSAMAKGEEASPFLANLRRNVSVSAMLADPGEIHWTADAEVISDPPEKAMGRKGDHWLMGRLGPVIASARHSLEITSPYFVPAESGTESLVAMAKRGVEVAVMTNSLAANDIAAVHGGYAPYRVALLKGGVKLYELQPEGRKSRLSILGSSRSSLHTKAFTVDDHTGFIGSFNFDARSISLNTEMGVLFNEPVLVERMRVLFRSETDPGSSYRVSLSKKGSLRWHGEKHCKLVVFDREPEARFTRRLTAALIAWLPIESQL